MKRIAKADVKKASKQKAQKVWIVTYDHRHSDGEPGDVYASYASALHAAIGIVQANLDEVENDDVIDLINKRISQGHLSSAAGRLCLTDALDAWQDWQDEFGAPPETITLTEREVLS